MSAIDLSTLPAPAVVEPLDFERIVAAIKADLIARYPDCAEVLDLESEPLTKLIEAVAYRELLYRARVNDAARAHLLAYATGGDLEHLAALFGVTRMTGEADERLRARLQLRIAALGGQGTPQYYEYVAMTASTNVRAARAMQPEPGHVRVLLWLAVPDIDGETAQMVDAALHAGDAVMLGVTVTVGVARPRFIDVRARIWRTAAALPGLLDVVAQRLAGQLASQAALGCAIARSWVVAALHADGVAAVQFMGDDAPPETVQLAFDEYPALGVAELIDGGVL